MKKFAALIFLLAFLINTGCKDKSAITEEVPIKIAGAYWPGTYWIDVAEQKGWFKEQGLNAVVIDTNADYYASHQQLVNGILDTVNMQFFDLVRLNVENANIKGVLVTDYSQGSEVIVARPGINSIRDLKGKRIGITKNTYGEYIFSVVADRDRLPLDQVHIVDIVGEQAFDELLKGNVDAVFIWEPFTTQALEKIKGSKIIFSTAEIPGIAGGVQCFRKRFVKERPGDVKKILQVWQRASRFIRQNPDESYRIVAQKNKVTVEEVRNFTRLGRVLDLQENRRAFSFASGFDSIHGTTRQINDFMIRIGMNAKKLDTTQIVDSSFVRNLPEQ